MEAFEDRLARLDPELFQWVLSQSTDEDKRSFLAAQTAVRNQFDRYTYLEIGSYKGGSLQPFVLDPRCERVLSIDSRPSRPPDSRGADFYPENTTASMLEGLKRIPGADIQKITCYETGTERLAAKDIPVAPHYCFVDGEHTNEAVLRDGLFCLAVARPDALIAFHDANLVYTGLAAFLKELSQSGREFRAYLLPDSLFVVELGAVRFQDREPVRARFHENYKAYLSGMAANDWYRYVYHLPAYRRLRWVRRTLFGWVKF